MCLRMVTCKSARSGCRLAGGSAPVTARGTGRVGDDRAGARRRPGLGGSVQGARPVGPGLVLLAGIGGDPERPWDRQEFRDPDDLTEVDHLDAAALLREDWRQQTTEYDDYDEEDEEYQDDYFARSIAEMVAPFSRRQFPALPRRRITSSAPAARPGAERAGPGPYRPGAAGRPADALPMLGWNDALVTAVPKAAVLRSWEDRFGARLLRVGLAEFSVLARRPPRALESAQLLAAEQWAFAAYRRHRPARRLRHHCEPDEVASLDLLVGLSTRNSVASQAAAGHRDRVLIRRETKRDSDVIRAITTAAFAAGRPPAGPYPRPG